jgi:DNA ligase-1
MSIPSINFPKLYKLSSKGVTQIWSISARGRPDGTADTQVLHGQKGGAIQESVVHVKVGKNLGRKNATTCYEQAVKDAESKWKKQKDKGYSEGEAREMVATKPMLAHPYEKYGHKIDWDDCWYQPKLDGIRCIAARSGDEITLWSRMGKPITTVPHVADELRRMMGDGEIWDGELYIHGVRFQRITSLVKRAQPGSETLEYHVYDAVSDGSFLDRYVNQVQLTLAANAIDPEAKVKPVYTSRVLSHTEAVDAHNAWVASKYEGIILRHSGCAYKVGYRSQELLKLKASIDEEFEIVGVKEGEGKFEGLGIFQCKTAAGAAFDATPRGTDAERREFWENRASYVGKQLTVRFFEWTSSEPPVPRFPVGISVRDYE